MKKILSSYVHPIIILMEISFYSFVLKDYYVGHFWWRGIESPSDQPILPRLLNIKYMSYYNSYLSSKLALETQPPFHTNLWSHFSNYEPFSFF